jgi:hypothetical protein
MNEPAETVAHFELPCSFEMHVSTIFGSKPTGAKDENGLDIMMTDNETRRIRVLLTAFPNGASDASKGMQQALESWEFKDGDINSKKQAWLGIRYAVSHAIANALTTEDERPQFVTEESENGTKLTVIQ